ncbi:hypothetical protein CEXT_35311 [Caerostris extrusa]|uniref:Uncharacterized protein n=1 Tax=Caerostris extrusa TaxID=172846 RepID=A0AAV4VVL6_CAEEX|nr:hypothetical protein CEXT_35311 [Caerostris extrusa]
MWKNIGHNPMFRIEQSAEDALSRTSSSQSFHRVNCAGSSRGLFLGLFLLVISTICLIVFFVFIHHENLNLLAVYLSDLSHSIIMLISIFAIIVGFFGYGLYDFITTVKTILGISCFESVPLVFIPMRCLE